MILSPEKPVSKIIAKIVKRNGDIYTRFTEKRDDFRKAIKSLGFHWNGCEWQKEINQYTGDADSRQVQTAHYLLSHGTAEWMIENNVALEIDYQTALRWNKVGQGFMTYWSRKNPIGQTLHP